MKGSPHKTKPASLHHTLSHQITPLPSYAECFRFALHTLRAENCYWLWPGAEDRSVCVSATILLLHRVQQITHPVMKICIIYLPSCLFSNSLWGNRSCSKNHKRMLTVIVWLECCSSRLQYSVWGTDWHLRHFFVHWSFEIIHV